jgi:5-methylcytosine-specific restriction endonuclease McrA
MNLADAPDTQQYEPAPSGFVPTGTRIPGSVRKAVIERDGMVCKLCGRKVVLKSGKRRRTKGVEAQLTLDHIVPISKGGGPTVDNLRVTCRACNMKRASGGMLPVAKPNAKPAVSEAEPTTFGDMTAQEIPLATEADKS